VAGIVAFFVLLPSHLSEARAEIGDKPFAHPRCRLATTISTRFPRIASECGHAEPGGTRPTTFAFMIGLRAVLMARRQRAACGLPGTCRPAPVC
jgi:hypothetical protein